MSDNSTKNIDQLFKQKLEGFEMSTQDSSWKMLQLAKQNSLHTKKALLLKMLLETALLGFSALLIFSSNGTNFKKAAVQPMYAQSKSHSFSELSTKNIANIDSKENFKEITFSNHLEVPTQQEAINFQSKNTAASDEPLKTKLSHQKLHSITSYLKPKLEQDFKFGININEEVQKQLLLSEATTHYKNWSPAKKTALQKTSQKGVNSTFDEYAPIVSKNGSYMFFTSRRPITNKELRKGNGKERIYYSETNKTGWTNAQLLPAPINSESNFNSAVAISNDGKSLFIYRDDRYGNGDFFKSDLVDSKWSTPTPLPSPINSEFHESTLSLTADGNTIFFTSNRVGGRGGMDIWYSKKNKAGMWGEAKNLGDVINTENDEEGVYIHPNGKTLFFSSRGHKGLGGYDIFYTTLKDGEWTEPINLGPEINTAKDDVYFVLAANGEDAYYSSIDPETPHKKDIFKIKYNHDSHQNFNDANRSLIKGTILSKTSNRPIKARIEIYKQDNQTLVKTINSDEKTGDFSILLPINEKYQIQIYKSGYLYYSEEVSTHSSGLYQEVNKKIQLDSLKVNSKFALTDLKLNNDNNFSVDQSINFALDNLYKLMIANPKLRIQFSSEANTSQDAITENLQVVVEKAVSHLISKGISSSRLDRNIIQYDSTLGTDKKDYRLYINITSI